MAGIDSHGSLDDGTSLHLGDFRIGDGQTAATVTHHRVELMQGGNDILDVLDGLALCLGKCLDVFLFGGNELVERRIQEANGNRHAVHGFVDAFKVSLLHRLQLCKSCDTLFNRVGADHLTEDGNTVLIEEHMLGCGHREVCLHWCEHGDDGIYQPSP